MKPTRKINVFQEAFITAGLDQVVNVWMQTRMLTEPYENMWEMAYNEMPLSPEKAQKLDDSIQQIIEE